MSKKILIKNKKVYKPKIKANIYGGESAFSSGNLGNTLGSIGGGLTDIVSAGIANSKVDTTTADNAIEAVNSFKPATSSLDALASSYNAVTFANTEYDPKDFMVSTGEGLANMGKAALSGATAGASLGPWGAVGGLAAGLAVSGAGWLAGKAKAKSKADELARRGRVANLFVNDKAVAARDDIKKDIYNDFMQDVKSYGGPLYNLGGDFNNGLIFIDEGGTHEQNPFGGVLMGVDNEGTPNLVEEGEIIYNDYVFSNRLKPTKKLLIDSGFSDKYKDWTFAKIVEDLQKESAERPNDIISKAGLDDMMNRMITMQETIRARKGKTGQNRMVNIAASGGNIFDGTEDRKSYWGVDPYLSGSTLDISAILDAANEKINFENPIFEPDSFRDLPPVNPPLNLPRKLGVNRLPSEVSSTNNLASTGVGGLDPTLNSISQFDNKIRASQQQRVNNGFQEYVNERVSEALRNRAVEEAEREDAKNKKGEFNWDTLGMLAPTISNIGKSIYNIAKKPDTSNFIAAEAYSQVPDMNLPTIGGKINYRGIDRSRFTTPIINQGRATARDIQNIGGNASNVLNRMALNTYNTQKALAEANFQADQQDLSNRLSVGQFNFGIDKAEVAAQQAEQAAMLDKAYKIAAGKVSDAMQLEQAEQMRGQAFDKTSTAVTQGIADLTRQNIEWEMIKNNPALAEAIAIMSSAKTKASSKYGGMLTKRNRRK